MPGVTEIVKEIHENFPGEKIQFGEIVEQFEDRGFGPLLLVPALIAILPTGAIPFVPTLCGLLIILISVQILFGKAHPWLPKRLRNASVRKEKFDDHYETFTKWTKRFDKLVSERLVFLTRNIATRVVAFISILLGALMPPLELLPLACAIPGVSIALFAVGLSSKDGLIILLALGAAAATGIFAITFWPF